MRDSFFFILPVKVNSFICSFLFLRDQKFILNKLAAHVVHIYPMYEMFNSIILGVLLY